MNTQPQTPADFQAAISGMTLAFRDTLIALIKLQPDAGVLAEVLFREREETIALLLNKGVPDATIEAYRDMMDSIRPYRSDEDSACPS